MRTLIVILLLSFLIFQSCQEKKQSLPDMTSNWEFREVGESFWHSAKVPGCVHTDLFSHQLIDDPFYRDNEAKLQWVDKKDWEYKKEWLFDRSILNGKQVWLRFEGLDSYAEVFLNGKLILKSSNMFVGYDVCIDPYLRDGNNTLKVIFRSPIKSTIPYFDKTPYSLPVSANDNDTIGGVQGKRLSVFMRKAPFQFGWDFAPRFVTSGIWRPIHLYLRYENHIVDVQVNQVYLDVDSANLEVVVDVDAAHKQSAQINLSVKDAETIHRQITLVRGRKKYRFAMRIDNPDFWWPRTYGKQSMYKVNVQLTVADSIISEKTKTFGLRTVELVREKDSVGTGFYFGINKTPIFARGANMIPQHIFPTEITQRDMRNKLKDVVDANMNMIRIWGGGVYPDNYFYKLCDSLGILVWQDFMFACSMIPDYSGYFNMVHNEVEYNVKRLRNHPSLIMWCGNNEVISAWNNWGWQKKVEKEQGKAVAKRIYSTYDSLFHKLIPAFLDTLDPQTPYWSSSPQSDIGEPKNTKSGDLHYWMVWWGKAPFSEFRENTGRFVSEYGFQSLPPLSSLQSFMRKEEFSLKSDGFMAHQKSTGGNGRLLHYLDLYYTSETSFDNYPYLTQLLQARAMEMAIQFHRTKKPYNMGTLLWQLNDCWPAISWSIQDFYGRRKAAYYAVQEAFEPVAVFADTLPDSLQLVFVSDAPKVDETDYIASVIDFLGNVLYNQEGKVALSTDSTTKITLELDLTTLDKDGVFILVKYEADDDKQKLILLNQDNRLKLPNPQFTYEIKKKRYGAELKITAPVFIRSMYVAFPPYDVEVTPNFVDMEPGREYTFKIKTQVQFNLLESSIRFKNVNGFMKKIEKKSLLSNKDTK